MKNGRRIVASMVVAGMLAGSVPARAESSTSNVLYGLLVTIGVSLGIVAWQADLGGRSELKVRDEIKRDKKKDGARIEIVPPPSSNDEARSHEIAGAIAFTARF